MQDTTESSHAAYLTGEYLSNLFGDDFWLTGSKSLWNPTPCCIAFLVNCWPTAIINCLEVLQRSPALCTMIGSNNQPLSCNKLFNFCCKKWCFEYHNMYTTMLLQWQWNKVYYSVCNKFSSPICCVGAAIKQYFYSKRCMYPTASKRNFDMCVWPVSGGAAEESCPLYNDRIKQSTLILQHTFQFLLPKNGVLSTTTCTQPCICNGNEIRYITASATTSHHQYAA